MSIPRTRDRRPPPGLPACIGGLLLFSLPFMPAAHAQSADAAGGMPIEEMRVTGSRIVRRDASAVGPLTTLTSSDIQNTAAMGIGDVLQSLPNVGVSLNSNGTQGTSFGVSTVNLRYLGSVEGSGNRSLILVDGRRWVNAAGGRGFRDFVDLNTVPMAIVDSVEVLKDGASAVYGADAIAGVVNIRTRRDFEGLDTRLRTGQTTHSDGRSTGIDVTYGHRLGNGSLLLSASYVDIEPILTTDRKLTERTSVPLTAPPTSPRGLYVLPGISTTAAPLTRIPGTAGTSPDHFRTASLPEDDYNTLAQGHYLTGPSERFGLFGRIRTDLTSTTAFQTELLFNWRESAQMFSPLLMSMAGNNGYTIPADHPFNPYGVDFAGSGFRIQRVPVEVGNRVNTQEVKTFRVTTGLDGMANYFERDWDWDLFAAYSQNEATFRAENQIHFDRLALALGPNDRCAANSCVPIDIFGAITPAMADYIRHNATDENGTAQYNAGLNVTGRITELPAGWLGVAAGIELRRETAYDNPSRRSNEEPEFVTGINRTSSPVRDPTSGSYNVKEAYLEFDVPVLADVPGAANLDLSVAARYSHYNTFGGEATTKLGLGWRPIDDVLVRATYSEGFRAPSILELYQGGRETNFQAVDPCNDGGAGLPGCAGVPAEYHQTQFGSGLIRGVTGGNRDLEPETAETRSVGIVLTPRFADGLSLMVDWFKIDVDNAIAARNAQQILNACANLGGANCGLVLRDPFSGEVTQLRQSVMNFASVEVEGVDATLRYNFDTPLGAFSAVLDTARLIRFVNRIPQPDGTVVVDDRAGRSDAPRSTLPYWKAQGSLRWASGPYEAGWRGRYIGDSKDIPNNAVNGGKVSSVVYHDVQFAYRFDRWQATLALGVDNVFDKDPPASRANAPINFDIYTYDARGAHYYLQLNVSL
jgi:iron complex outermembrane recepter protein